MINNLEIASIHTEADKDVVKYVNKKIGGLDTYLPRFSRSSVHGLIKLKESNAKDKKQFTCEVILYVPGEIITAKETTVNMFAAVDIVEEKLKGQLRKYKTQNTGRETGKHNSSIKSFFGKITRKTNTK